MVGPEIRSQAIVPHGAGHIHGRQLLNHQRRATWLGKGRHQGRGPSVRLARGGDFGGRPPRSMTGRRG